MGSSKQKIQKLIRRKVEVRKSRKKLIHRYFNSKRRTRLKFNKESCQACVRDVLKMSISLKRNKLLARVGTNFVSYVPIVKRCLTLERSRSMMVRCFAVHVTANFSDQRDMDSAEGLELYPWTMEEATSQSRNTWTIKQRPT